MQTRKFSTGETIIGLVILVVVLWFIWTLFKTLFGILSWASPFLFIGALIINRKVVFGFGKMLFSLVSKNPLMGIAMTLLIVFAFPFVSLILFGLALMNKKADNILNLQKQERDGMPTDFREISSTPRSGYDDLLKK